MKAPITLTLFAALTVWACRARPEPAPVPGESAAPAATAETAERTRRGYTAGDVLFMQGMIVHHAQALEMTALIPARTSRQDMHLLGERIAVSQRDEITMMQRWLRERGEDVQQPGAHGAHHAGRELMPGMLTPEEMARLRAAKGSEFEREFLRLMIKHHEGALAMVATLFSTHGAGQDTEMYFFASDVDADQRAEISRMQSMLAAMSSSGTPSSP